MRLKKHDFMLEMNILHLVKDYLVIYIKKMMEEADNG